MTGRGSISVQQKRRSDRGTRLRTPRHWFVESLPRSVLADTGPLFALIHAGDADHARAVQFARRFTGRLITTWPVLTEVSYLLLQSDRRGVAVLLGMIQDGHLSVADLDSSDVEYMRTLIPTTPRATPRAGRIEMDQACSQPDVKANNLKVNHTSRSAYILFSQADTQDWSAREVLPTTTE